MKGMKEVKGKQHYTDSTDSNIIHRDTQDRQDNATTEGTENPRSSRVVE